MFVKYLKNNIKCSAELNESNWLISKLTLTWTHFSRMNSSDDLLSWLDMVVGMTVAIGVMSMGWVEATAIGRIEATMALVSARISAVLRTGWTGVEYRWGCDDCVVIGRMLALRWGVSVVTTLSTYKRFVHCVEELNNFELKLRTNT